MKKPIFSFVFTLILFAASVAHANVLECVSCVQSEVQSKIDVASSGDTVTVPAGECSWSTKVNIPNTTAIILQGAGEGQTIITDATATGGANPAIKLRTLPGYFYRITGFTFKGTVSGASEGVINIVGTGNEFRIDHCTFDNVTAAGIVVGWPIYGIIDHCTFNKTNNTSFMAIVINGGNTAGDTIWESGYTFGSSNAVFVEDCDFDYDYKNDSAMQGHNGAVYVFRNNTIRNTVIDVHGADSSKRSGMAIEVYDNIWTIDVGDSSVPRAVSLRGGTGYIYDNTITATGSNGSMTIGNFRTCYGVGWTTCYSPTNCNRCDGDEAIDGNEDATGYPCRDQIGIMGPGQTKVALYEYNNIKNGADIDFTVGQIGCSDPAETDQIVLDRDYYNDTAKPGYTAYTYPHPLAGEGTNVIIGKSPTSFNFSKTTCSDTHCHSTQTLLISNPGAGTLTWETSNTQSWLTLSPTTGQTTTGTSNVTLTVNISALPIGNYEDTITITDANASNNPQTVSVYLTVLAADQPIITVPGTMLLPGTSRIYGIGTGSGRIILPPP